jgi:tRNA (Thr-GGU) A37 N-methylase
MENILTVAGIDVTDGAPLLDIKSYVPEFEPDKFVKIGWLEERI